MADEATERQISRLRIKDQSPRNPKPAAGRHPPILTASRHR